MREHFVVPSIRSREVAGAQRSGVRLCEDALKALDFGNGLLGVHSVTNIQHERGYRQTEAATVFSKAIRALPIAPNNLQSQSFKKKEPTPESPESLS